MSYLLAERLPGTVLILESMFNSILKASETIYMEDEQQVRLSQQLLSLRQEVILLETNLPLYLSYSPASQLDKHLNAYMSAIHSYVVYLDNALVGGDRAIAMKSKYQSGNELIQAINLLYDGVIPIFESKLINQANYYAWRYIFWFLHFHDPYTQ